MEVWEILIVAILICVGVAVGWILRSVEQK